MTRTLTGSASALSESLRKLRKLDLNRLMVFVAIYECQSVSGAASALGMTQPAVSMALKSLRKDFQEELFFRSGCGVCATHLATKLAQRIIPAVTQLNLLTHLTGSE